MHRKTLWVTQLLYFCHVLSFINLPMPTPKEEDYLKAIFTISEKEMRSVSTGAIARQLQIAPATVTDMLVKLSTRQLIIYEKYKGVSLTPAGNRIATGLIRRNRLWLVFLVQKLRFSWHQVEEITESMEHIESEELISRLDAFLDYPRFDPFGDPIPNADGKFTIRTQATLTELSLQQSGTVLGVKEHSTDFLLHLSKLNIRPGAEIRVIEKSEYDHSMKVIIDQKHEALLGKQVAQNILMKKN